MASWHLAEAGGSSQEGRRRRRAWRRSDTRQHGGFGGFILKTIGAWVYRFGPQNPGGVFEEERMACGGIEEFASRRSYLVKGAVAIR
jgi:hypothetical protein